MSESSPLSDLTSSRSPTRLSPDGSFSPSPEGPPFLVLLKPLDDDQRATYRPTSDAPPGNYFPDLDEIVGQYPSDNAKYYFARSRGGPCHRLSAHRMNTSFRGLVQKYRERKRRGDPPIPSFDPSASYVHPLSRLSNKAHLKTRITSVSSAYSSADISAEDYLLNSFQDDDQHITESVGDLESDEYSEDGDFSGSESREARRKSRRLTSKATSRAKILPYSPRKTRSHKILMDPSDDDDDEEDEMHLRRSTRAKKTITIPLHASDEDENENAPASPIHKQREKPRRKPIPGAYGIIRPIEDIDLDDDSDADDSSLRRHRRICEKCGEKPAHEQLDALAQKPPKKKHRAKRRHSDLEVSSDEMDHAEQLGGWVRCLKCCVSSHWKCIAPVQRDLVLKAVDERKNASLTSTDNGVSEDAPPPKAEPRGRRKLQCTETTEYLCAACTKLSFCIGCEQPICFDPNLLPVNPNSGDVTMEDGAQSAREELLFRCLTCKRPAHYRCMLDKDQQDLLATAEKYQHSWLCADCSSFEYKPERIIAWRPYPPQVQEAPWPEDQPNHWKTALPREYLVKWEGRPYRRAEWGVPHMWLVSTALGKLRNFIQKGSGIDFVTSDSSTDGNGHDNSDTPAPPTPRSLGVVPPHSSAFEELPSSWKMIDRVLDVLLWKRKGKKQRKQVTDSDEESDSDRPLTSHQEGYLEKGLQPPQEDTESIDAFESRTGQKLGPEHINLVAWGFFKWRDLGYDDSSWDSPPLPTDEVMRSAFAQAFERFIMARCVKIPKWDKATRRKYLARNRIEHGSKAFLKDASQLHLGQDEALKLMPFQVEGFDWLCTNWWNDQPCILADEMGLGKTVQICCFIGKIAESYNANPVLIVVPNSTITNWVREFERWAPRLTVVPFHGESKARDVVKRFELWHPKARKGCLTTRFHVLITTYETLTSPKDFTLVFKNQPYWEALVVDEGQRLKSDTSLLFKKLNELNVVHRVILTGTPLNNNIRELFNLMNFLDPVNWNNLAQLEAQYSELNEDLIKELHNKLRPYFLRRIKSEVISLPPKNEVIVPVSMTSLQKQVYKGLLSKNADILKSLLNSSANRQQHNVRSKVSNLLMELRKVLQHPYLHDPEIEDRTLSSATTHERLVDASAKLRFLRQLLSQLKARGHRVLLFSQFKIALDIVEDFLNGEGYKYLRLDGDTKGGVRQRGMDEFNKPGSDVFIYLLTTRAGGVGINLYTADTVIIFDPDFNPHQDLQAIARAHRFGQKKTCMVFKLMVKDSAEERIIQIGKKKLVLDHLIVQKMDEEDEAGEDVQSILTHGAQALFEVDQEAKDISYTDHDVLQLIEKTESQSPEEETRPADGGFTFSFAKVWTSGNGDLVELQDQDQVDSWAATLAKINAEREKEQVDGAGKLGRGVRRAAAQAARIGFVLEEDSPGKPQRRSRSVSVGSVYGAASPTEDSDKDSDVSATMRNDPLPDKQQGPFASLSASSSAAPLDTCGLCGGSHGGQCTMTESSQNLAEYRQMLFYDNGEPWQDRRAAILAIDEELHNRGDSRLIDGQPLHFLLPNPQPQAHLITPMPRPFQVSGPLTYEQPPSGSNPPKRPPSPQAQHGAPQPKRPKAQSNCPVCGASPFHSLSACPVILGGPASISQAIRRLSLYPGTQDTITSLNQVLSGMNRFQGGQA